MDVRLKETYELSILGNNPAQTATTNQHTKHEYLVFTVCRFLLCQQIRIITLIYSQGWTQLFVVGVGFFIERFES
jgi:hypothetical protein